MNWALKGLGGALNNRIFPLQTELTLGRQGKIAIADPRSSALHARINQDANGHWFLEDNSSKNGTRIAGERITRAPLHPGVKFFIGDQGFEVIESQADEITETPKPPSV